MCVVQYVAGFSFQLLSITSPAKNATNFINQTTTTTFSARTNLWWDGCLLPEEEDAVQEANDGEDGCGCDQAQRARRHELQADVVTAEEAGERAEEAQQPEAPCLAEQAGGKGARQPGMLVQHLQERLRRVRVAQAPGHKGLFAHARDVRPAFYR